VIRHRSYAVPLTAVLLAVATGVALGAGPLNGSRSDASGSPRVVTRAPDATYAEAFAGSVASRLYAGGLSRRPVALVAMPGADRSTVDALVGQVKAAGGQVTATYTVQGQLVDPNQKSLVDTLGLQLAEQVGGIDKSATTYPRLGRLLALAITTTARTGVRPGDGATAVRQSLAAAHLLSVPRGGPALAPLVLVVLGTPVDQAIADGLLEGLAQASKGVVAVAPTRDPVLAGLHADGVTRDVTTVDGSETSAGRVAAVLGLIREWGRQGGSFGASGSDGAVPLG
jgi:hypothetical protein